MLQAKAKASIFYGISSPDGKTLHTFVLIDTVGLVSVTGAWEVEVPQLVLQPVSTDWPSVCSRQALP